MPKHVFRVDQFCQHPHRFSNESQSVKTLMRWSPQNAIRARRVSLRLSQADLARVLGISKSMLSLIESGKRQPTDKQVVILSKQLQMPPDLLMVGSGRMPPDVRDTNTVEVVSAVRQRTGARIVSYRNSPTVVPLPKSARAKPCAEDIPDQIDVLKTSAAFRAHSYHTKVPPEAVKPFIRAFTRDGDVVFDPFCGSGMSGVAALMENRHALLSDVSPAAVHIARNYTKRCDPVGLVAAFDKVEQAIRPTIDWLYRPLGSKQIVEYTTWSDIYRCPACGKNFSYWDAVQRNGGAAADRVWCSRCGTPTRKALLKWVGEEPVWTHCSAGKGRIESHRPTRPELALIEQVASAPIPYWIPAVQFGPEREMWRAGHEAMGIRDVAGFFTRRNLHALAALRHVIATNSEGRIRDALFFAFTAAVNRASRRYQWNAKRPTNVMTGTLYISSLRYEWNAWSLFRRKVADVLRYYRVFPATASTVDVFRRSAADLDCIPDSSIDMVFMDPPFGSNIFYADSSLLWEAWLGDLTDPATEIVINKHRTTSAGGKNIEHYGDLMQQSLAHCYRVVRPGGRVVLAFSNTDDGVWQTIQRAIASAGLQTASVHLLNKGQPSIKGVKGIAGKENVTTVDLVLCLEHRKTTIRIKAPFPPPPSFVDEIIRNLVLEAPCRVDHIYSAVIRACIEQNYSVAGISMPTIAARCREIGAVEHMGRWSLSPPKVDNDGNFFGGYLCANKMPRTRGKRPVPKSLGNARIAGGRSSTLYLAHSYHTKVPPEAIQPFIEHHTNPDDVILDPFCGSGMTGVAAALTGRRAILNDLSPAAIHLAWNHTRPCSPSDLADAFAGIEARLAATFNHLYHTAHSDGATAKIHWTLWSTRHRCRVCSYEFLLWDVIDRTSGRLGPSIRCPGCNTLVRRTEGLETLGSEPAWIAYETLSGKRFEKPAGIADVNHALGFRREAIRSWYPTTALSSDREMYVRCALHLQNIQTVADFYTPRNLQALSALWHEIMSVRDERVRRALAFAFTNTAWHGTKMRRFNARGGQRPLTGTLYIPQLSSEANVLEVMRNKIDQLQRYYGAYRPTASELPVICLGSAARLSKIDDETIDYIFTDPPFGSNIFYADCNVIWESWIGRLTDVSQDAVVNRSLSISKGGKSLEDYGYLIGGAMREMSRVLKRGAWATIVFHNTDAAVWRTIRTAADQAGFEFHEAAALDRKQQSHKGYKGRSESENVAHFDVVLNLRKSEKSLPKTKGRRSAAIDLTSMVAMLAKNPEISDRGLQGVHSEVMRLLASRGDAQFVSYSDVRELWEKFRQTDELRIN